MSCLKTLLMLAVVFLEVVSGSSAACCDSWNGNCALIVSQSYCDGTGTGIGSGKAICKWKDGACSNKVCDDFTSSGESSCLSINGYNQYEGYTLKCKWSNGACVSTSGVCSEWNSSFCGLYVDLTTYATCFYDSTTSSCRNAKCADFSSNVGDACNYEGSINGNGNCKMEGQNCVDASQCSDYSGGLISFCDNHQFGNDGCISDGTSCLKQVCSSATTQPVCEQFPCHWNGNACVDFTSCSLATTQARCDNHYAGGNKRCIFVSGSCKEAACSDFTTSISCPSSGPSSFSSPICDWDSINNKCVPYSCADNNNSEIICDTNGCEPLSSCPATGGDSSSVIFVPALLVALLLMLL